MKGLDGCTVLAAAIVCDVEGCRSKLSKPLDGKFLDVTLGLAT